MTNFVSMCQALMDNVNFREDSPVGAPDGSPFDAQKLQNVVKSNQNNLPRLYRSGYATPLLDALPELVVDRQRRLDSNRQGGMSDDEASADVESIADPLVGAVQDWGVAQYAPALRRFEAVVSNFYRSFLSDEQRARLSCRSSKRFHRW